MREEGPTILRRRAYTLLRNGALSHATQTIKLGKIQEIFVKRDINRKLSIRCKNSPYKL